MPIPTPFAVGRVNCYLLEDEPLTLIDTGPNSGKALNELESALATFDHTLEEVELVIVSHQHLDHFGLVATVVERSGAEVAALEALIPVLANFGEDVELEDQAAANLMMGHGVPEEVVESLRNVVKSFRSFGSKVDVTRGLRDGERLEFGNRTLEVIHRPGHSPSDTLFWDEERKILASADHLIKKISSNALISRPLDGSEGRRQALVEYIDSMAKTRDMPAEIVLPGHGEPFTGHATLIDDRLAMHERRAHKLYGLIEERPRTAHELAHVLWGNIAVTQAFLTLSEVIGHTDLLVNAGQVREVTDGDTTHFEVTGEGDGRIAVGNQAREQG